MTGQVTQNLEWGRKVCGETRHDPRDEIVKLIQQWDERLRLPLTEIPQGYHRGKLSIVLQIGFGFCLGDYSLQVTHHRISEGVGINCDPTAGNAQDKFFVLIRNVHVMEQQQGIGSRIGGIVRLKPLDHVQNSDVADSLYFSFVTGKTVFVPWPRFQDGKFDEPSIFAAPVIGRGELPNDVVKAGTQMVDDLARQDAKSERNSQFLKVLECLKEKLHIFLWDNCITAFLEEPIGLDLQIKDVLAGPL